MSGRYSPFISLHFLSSWNMYYCKIFELCSFFLYVLWFTLSFILNFSTSAFNSFSSVLFISSYDLFIILSWFFLIFLAASNSFDDSLIWKSASFNFAYISFRTSPLLVLSVLLNSSSSFLYLAICLYPFSSYLFIPWIDLSGYVYSSFFFYSYFFLLNFEVSSLLILISSFRSLSFFALSCDSLWSLAYFVSFLESMLVGFVKLRFIVSLLVGEGKLRGYKTGWAFWEICERKMFYWGSGVLFPSEGIFSMWRDIIDASSRE